MLLNETHCMSFECQPIGLFLRPSDNQFNVKHIYCQKFGFYFIFELKLIIFCGFNAKNAKKLEKVFFIKIKKSHELSVRS